MRGQRTADVIGLYNDDNREILFLRSSRDGLMLEQHVAQAGQNARRSDMETVSFEIRRTGDAF